MATLTLGILDMASGKMAAGVDVQIRKIVDGAWQQMPDAKTQSNGRAVLCESKTLQSGGYFEVLVFLGKYFDQTARSLPQIKLVDIIPLRFGIEEGSEDVCIHMSISPHSYSAGFSTQPDAALPVDENK